MEKIDRQQAEKWALLRAAWKDGVDSTDAGTLDFTALKQEARAFLAAIKPYPLKGPGTVETLREIRTQRDKELMPRHDDE